MAADSRKKAVTAMADDPRNIVVRNALSQVMYGPIKPPVTVGELKEGMYRDFGTYEAFPQLFLNGRRLPDDEVLLTPDQHLIVKFLTEHTLVTVVVKDVLGAKIMEIPKVTIPWKLQQLRTDLTSMNGLHRLFFGLAQREIIGEELDGPLGDPIAELTVVWCETDLRPKDSQKVKNKDKKKKDGKNKPQKKEKKDKAKKNKKGASSSSSSDSSVSPSDNQRKPMVNKADDRLLSGLIDRAQSAQATPRQ